MMAAQLDTIAVEIAAWHRFPSGSTVRQEWFT